MSTQITEKQRKIHPNSLMNLRPFQPGQSGNPGGVKKGSVYISEAYKRLLALPEEELVMYRPRNAAEAIALRQIGAAIFGANALDAAKEITDRTEGRARQHVDLANITEVEKERAKFESAVEGIIDETGCSYEDAVKALVTINPENERFLQ
jgi:hypothetical protein